jgi:hypothetical protein
MMVVAEEEGLVVLSGIMVDLPSVGVLILDLLRFQGWMTPEGCGGEILLEILDNRMAITSP